MNSITCTPKAFISESGHAFCPVCPRTLLRFAIHSRHHARCARCNATFIAEPETAFYQVNTPHFLQRFAQSKSGILAAALGASIAMASCEDKATPSVQQQSPDMTKPETTPTNEPHPTEEITESEDKPFERPSRIYGAPQIKDRPPVRKIPKGER